MGPTIHQRQLMVWSIRWGYVMALGQMLLGYSAGLYPDWVVLLTASLGVGVYRRVEQRLALRNQKPQE